MANIFYHIACMLLLSFTAINATGQSLAINTDGSTAQASALLDVKSIDKGILIPRMNKAQKNAIASPATGLMVFQNAPDSTGFYFYNGSSWNWLSSVVTDTIAWKTAGNSGLPDTSFIGHRDLKPLNFRLNNLRYGRIHPTNSAISFGRHAGNISNTTGHVAIGDSAASVITSILPGVFIGNKAGKSVTNGGNNVFVGNLSGTNNTSGTLNSFYGSESGTNNTTGSQNVFVGYSSGTTNKQSLGNTAVGTYSLASHEGTGAAYNTAIGYTALGYDSIGIHNTGVGFYSLISNNKGQRNTAIGSYTGASQKGGYNFFGGAYAGYGDRSPGNNFAADSGSYNTALGGSAMYRLANGNHNTSIGYGSLFRDSSGGFNTVVGAEASNNGDTASYVSSIGYRSLSFNNRSGNTALGAFSGYNNSRSSTNPLQGIENTIVGYAAMYGNNAGSKNAVLGYKAMGLVNESVNGYASGSPSRNVAVGDSALYNNLGNDNIGIGYLAAGSINSSASSANVVIGSKALFSNTRGSGKTAIGHEALFADTMTSIIGETAVGYHAMRNSTNSQFNTAIGGYALQNTGVGATITNYWGGFNTAVGYSSLLSNLTGYSNTAIGMTALSNNQTGDGNVVIGTYANSQGIKSRRNVTIGHFAGYNNDSTQNVFVGEGCGFSNTTGSRNTFIGNTAGSSNISGSTLSLFGYNAECIGTNLTNATAIGAYATVAQSNSLVLGSSVNVGIGINTPNTKLHIDGATDANVAIPTSGFLLLGDATAANLVFDDNEIIARSNSAAATLYLQYQSGNVVIGANTAGSHKLSVNGDAAKVGGGSWAVYSDRRLKKHITPYTDGLSSLLKINPVSFNYNQVTGYDTKQRYVGVVAQELQRVSPYMVADLNMHAPDGSAYLQVDNSAMTYMLINAVKEQQQQINELKEITLQQQKMIKELQVKQK